MVSAFVAWFVHVKSISLVDAALAVRLLGLAGGLSFVRQMSVIGATLALWPAYATPYISSIVRSKLKWLMVSPYWPGLTMGPRKSVATRLFPDPSSSSQVTM